MYLVTRLKVNRAGIPETISIVCSDVDRKEKRILQVKRNNIQSQPIEPKKIIIGEGRIDKAMEILQKRYAKGEIWKDEFHDKVQLL